jgi:transposase
MLFQKGRAYSQDLRERVFALADVGNAVGEVAEALCVSIAYVSKVLGRRRNTGECSARPQRCHVPPKLLGLHDAIRAEVKARPDATLAELRCWLGHTHKVCASDGLMHATLVRLGLTRKKKTLHAAEQERPDVAEARAEWRKEQPSLTTGRLIFLDETSIKTNMVRQYGRSPRGERLVASVPHGHHKTSTFIGCLHEGGMICPYVLDGAVNGELFVSYVEQHLATALRSGDIVFMDNLPVHKLAGVRAAIEAVGAQLLYLPAYSPDLNPIEMAFAKLKSQLRAAAIRTVDALWNAVGKLCLALTPAECVNFIRHCGYPQSS